MAKGRPGACACRPGMRRRRPPSRAAAPCQERGRLETDGARPHLTGCTQTLAVAHAGPRQRRRLGHWERPVPEARHRHRSATPQSVEPRASLSLLAGVRGRPARRRDGPPPCGLRLYCLIRSRMPGMTPPRCRSPRAATSSHRSRCDYPGSSTGHESGHTGDNDKEQEFPCLPSPLPCCSSWHS